MKDEMEESSEEIYEAPEFEYTKQDKGGWFTRIFGKRVYRNIPKKEVIRQNSVEIFRNADMRFSFRAKLYYKSTEEIFEINSTLELILRDLERRFEKP